MNKLMLSCKNATGLMEKKNHAKLTLGEKAKLCFHTAMCDACRRYEKQSQVLEGLFKAKLEEPGRPPVQSQPVGLEEKILRKLEEK